MPEPSPLSPPRSSSLRLFTARASTKAAVDRSLSFPNAGHPILRGASVSCCPLQLASHFHASCCRLPVTDQAAVLLTPSSVHCRVFTFPYSHRHLAAPHRHAFVAVSGRRAHRPRPGRRQCSSGSLPRPPQNRPRRARPTALRRRYITTQSATLRSHTVHRPVTTCPPSTFSHVQRAFSMFPNHAASRNMHPPRNVTVFFARAHIHGVWAIASCEARQSSTEAFREGSTANQDSGDDASCFQADATVVLADGSCIRMSELKVGDMIRTHPEKSSTSQMFLSSHREKK